MASYDQELPSDDLPVDIESMMTQKAHELFAVCDAENKGFITKRDMQRLQQELPLNPEQLESVFDSLDDDGNGFLTLEEFTTGFGCFIGIRPPIENQASEESGNSDRIYESEHQDLDFGEEDELFQETMAQIGASGVLEDQQALRELWARLRRDEPEMLVHFEDFIGKMTSEVKRTQNDYDNLESALRSKTFAHDEEVRKLYDEMEQQIRAEKEKILAEERAKERQMKDELEGELSEKDRQLQDILRSQAEMEKKLLELNQADTETKMENERLMKEKQSLEDKLEHSQAFVEDTKGHIDSLRKQQKDEKRERARQAFQITEGIALERESLVKQLDMLREVNKKLKDEKEESWAKYGNNMHCELEAMGERAPDTRTDETTAATATGSDPAAESKDKPVYSTIPQESPKTQAAPKKQLTKQGSILSNYFGSPDQGGSIEDNIDEDIECDDDYILHNNPQFMQMNGSHGNGHMQQFDDPLRSSQKKKSKMKRYQSLDTSRMNEDDSSDGELSRGERKYRSLRGARRRHDSSDSDPDTEGGRRHDRSGPDGVRMAPVGASEVDVTEERRALPTTPERVFKVVFVGDSGVGKSTFIHQFCSHEFVDTFSATIGVDFQVKSILVDDHLIALQLWDTAGQERFRSITKQYFRKADGVLIMYDVTSENSFTNVRNWMTSIQEGVDEGTVVMLLGNKIDLDDDTEKRVVKEKDGAKLSETYSALFYETSSKSGLNVTESMLGLARLLQEKEDREMENAVTLNESEFGPSGKKKSGCC